MKSFALPDSAACNEKTFTIQWSFIGALWIIYDITFFHLFFTNLVPFEIRAVRNAVLAAQSRTAHFSAQNIYFL